jgi:hypothetical protein
MNLNEIVFLFFLILLFISGSISIYSVRRYYILKKEGNENKLKFYFRELWVGFPLFFYSILILLIFQHFRLKIGTSPFGYLSIDFMLLFLVLFPLVPYYIKFKTLK